MTTGAKINSDGDVLMSDITSDGASSFDSRLQTTVLTNLLNKSLGVQGIWSFEEVITVDDCIEGLCFMKQEWRELEGNGGKEERKLDLLYLNIIFDFLAKYATQQERYSFLSTLLLKALDRKIFDVNQFITIALQRANIIEGPSFKLTCKCIKRCIQKCAKDTVYDILRRVIELIQSLPTDLTPIQFKNVNRAIRILEMLVEPPHEFMSPYAAMIEITGDMSKVHWTLSGFFRQFHIQKQNLVSMLTILDDPELCRIVGPSKEEEFIPRLKIDRRHLLLPEDPQPPPTNTSTIWNRHVNSLLQMVREGVPLQVVKSQIASVSDIRHQTTSTSDMLLTANILRVIQLVNSIEGAPKVEEKNPDDAYGSWWDEWQHFADQFYSFVENGLLDYDKFMTTLSQSRTAKGQKLRDNAVIWLLTQCLPLNNIKELFRTDLQMKNGSDFGHLIPSVMGFYNKEQATNTALYHDLRDTSLTCLLFRVYNIIGTGASKEIQQYLNTLSEKVQNVTVHKYRKWWQETETPDFYTLQPKVAAIICVLSSFMSSRIANAISDFIQKPETDPSLTMYYNVSDPGLGFTGKLRPISINFLAHLSIRCRQRVLEGLELVMFSDEQKNPALVETYARLLYISPGSRNKYKLQSQLHVHNTESPAKLHTLLEILNFRLLRYFKFHSSTKELFLDLFGCLMRTTSHQLWHSLQNFLIKICLNLKYMLKFSKATDTVDFGCVLNRLVIVSLAKTLRTRGISDYAQVRDLRKILNRLYTVTPHQWSANTLKYFPSEFVEFYNQVQVPPQVITRDTVILEFKANQQYFAALDRSGEAFLNQYKMNPQSRPLFLCVVWLITLEHKKTDGLATAQQILYAFPPQELTQYIYMFTDFLLEESPIQGASPRSAMGPGFVPQVATTEIIREVGSLLASFVWTYHLIDFETLILALLDKDADPNSYPLIEYLLISDNQFSQRVEGFCSLNLNKEHWREENYYKKHRDYEQKFPEFVAGPGFPKLPSYYGNVCLRFLPIFDIMVGRLIENEKTELLLKLISKYFKLYSYHENPANFVADLLYYYFESPIFQQSDTKMRLLKLLESSSITFSSVFTQYFSTKNISVFSNQYYKHVIARLATGISTTYNSLPSTHANNQQKPSQIFHVFNEFSTTTSRTITSVVLELLVLPLPPNETTTHLLNVVFESQLRSFSTMESVGLILANLPTPFHRVLYEKALQVIQQDSVFMENSVSRELPPFTLHFASDYSSNISASIDNRANKILLLLQLFFHYSSVENLRIVPSLIAAIKPVKSIQQLYFLCKMVGPFIYRIAGNGELLGQILHGLMEGLLDLSPWIQSLVVHHGTGTNDANHPLSLLSVISDFFHHCKAVFSKLPAEVWPKMQGLVGMMSPELQHQLKHLFL